ncbi:pentapeptide repeat-containing protein [Streptomyces sp. NPDC052693]|uniref:pentapeptide repeat-containing protein n=1 Tax=Streptomyces sp. NPDC052693 TaxID=3155814 RepID=UPI003422A3EF
MTSAPSESHATTPPDWPHCGHGATPGDPVGCRGIHVRDHITCLAHLNEADRIAYLRALEPGIDIDHRGTPFTSELLDRLLQALRDPTTGLPRIGEALFGEASFSDDARFSGASFTGEAWFARASFSGPAWFVGASFSGTARFGEAFFCSAAWFSGASFSGGALFGGAAFGGEALFGSATFFDAALFRGPSATGTVSFGEVSFSGTVRFGGASFSGAASFSRASFSGTARFGGASFAGYASFNGASLASDARFDHTSFSGEVWFQGTSFSGDAWFVGTQFTAATRLGPLVCGGRVALDSAVFGQPVTLEIAARWVSCARTRWASTATLHLRYAELDLRDAVLEYPVVVSARPTCFPLPPKHPGDTLPETELSDHTPSVRLTSLGGVDAAHLALHDIELAECRFAGAVHLDQLKVDGWCTFASTPTSWYWRFPWRWSPRNTVAEEHHWRIRNAPHPEQATAQGWTPPPPDAPELRPAAVAALYRQLRKSLEDGRNEPDAADFYYGECEMRRHDATRPRGERALLIAYWALSGYGLRATRALTWLGAAMAATIAVMVLWGLPTDDPKPTTTGREVAVGQQIVLTTETSAPVNPTGPLTERVTTERFEKALRVVINSVVFRSSGQDLTTAGTYTEMTSRLAEPVLLGLAVLAVRSRIKR